MTHRVIYIGNFEPEHSTENDVRKALASLDVDVTAVQENIVDWGELTNSALSARPDFVLWTRTWSGDKPAQLRFLDAMRTARIPTVAYHLDRWFGLSREHLVRDEPFFRCALVITADGGHAREWRAAGVNHVWMPPAVSHLSIRPDQLGEFNDAYDWDVVFVGSWRQYGHPEWGYRGQLVASVGGAFPRRFRPFEAGVRGKDLADCYATARVVVGDSCLAGDVTHYWSDRIPETLGRGGFLIHPHVVGLDEHFTPGEHLVTYELGDFAQLHSLIAWYLDHPVERRLIAEAGREHVQAHHTYRDRMRDVIDLALSRGALRERQGVATVSRAGITAKFDLREPDAIVVDEVWNDGVYPLDPHDVADRVVVDIGANVGAFTIWAAKAGARSVHAYEPDPDNRARLETNLRLNHPLPCPVFVYAEAVQGADGEVWLGGDNANAHVVDAPATLTAVDEDVVDARSIDAVLIRAGERLVVKMDCEGCEHDVIATVDVGQLRRVDRLVMEYHEGPFGDGWTMPPTAFGRLVRKLSEDGMVTIVGRPSSGLVNIDWRRYGS